jgi:hypothetical protein
VARDRKQALRYLKAGYSPEQITDTLASVCPDHPELQDSYETIYTAIYAMPRGKMRTTVIGWLCFGHAKRRPRMVDASTEAAVEGFSHVLNRIEAPVAHQPSGSGNGGVSTADEGHWGEGMLRRYA